MGGEEFGKSKGTTWVAKIKKKKKVILRFEIWTVFMNDLKQTQISSVSQQGIEFF